MVHSWYERTRITTINDEISRINTPKIHSQSTITDVCVPAESLSLKTGNIEINPLIEQELGLGARWRRGANSAIIVASNEWWLYS